MRYRLQVKTKAGSLKPIVRTIEELRETDLEGPILVARDLIRDGAPKVSLDFVNGSVTVTPLTAKESEAFIKSLLEDFKEFVLDSMHEGMHHDFDAPSDFLKAALDAYENMTKAFDFEVKE